MTSEPPSTTTPSTTSSQQEPPTTLTSPVEVLPANTTPPPVSSEGKQQAAASTTGETITPGATGTSSSSSSSTAGIVTSSTASYETASLYVGDLRDSVAEGQLYDIFKNVGTVASIRVCRDNATRRSLGYAYVNFHNAMDANRAMDTMNYTLINGKPCRIMWSHRDPSRRRNGAGNTFIKNLDKSVNCQQLYDTFSRFGNIISCKVETDEHGNSKGYGYVHFENVEASNSAIASVNGNPIGGKPVYVAKFLSRKERLAAGADLKELRYTNVYIKELDHTITSDLLHAEFGKFGEITSAIVMRDDKTGASRGFGFVNYKEHDAAVKAVTDMNGAQIGSKKIVVCRAQLKAERQKFFRSRVAQMRATLRPVTGVNLYVRNLDENFTDEDLQKCFAPYGTITSAKVMRDNKEISKGFGFVNYSNAEDANKALTNLNGSLIHNKPLYIAVAQKKEDRRAQLVMQHTQRPRSILTSAPPILYGAGGVTSAMSTVPNRFIYPQVIRPPIWQGYPAQYHPRSGYVPYMRRPGTRRIAGQTSMPNPSYRQKTTVPRGPPYPVSQQSTITSTSLQSPIVTTESAVPPVRTDQQTEPFTDVADFDSLPQSERRQAIGERLYSLVYAQFGEQEQRVGKITGMLLESMELNELVALFGNNEELNKKINEANDVYEKHHSKITDEQFKETDPTHSSESK